MALFGLKNDVILSNFIQIGLKWANSSNLTLCNDTFGQSNQQKHQLKIIFDILRKFYSYITNILTKNEDLRHTPFGSKFLFGVSIDDFR